MKKGSITLNNIITCALYLVIGILLCILKTGSIEILMTIAGILFIAFGIYDIITNRENLVKGITEIVIGIVILALGWLIGTIVLLVFGVLIAIKGALDIFNNIKQKKGLVDLIVALVTIVIGIILCIAPFAIGDIICIVVGVIFIINGVLALFGKTIAKK